MGSHPTENSQPPAPGLRKALDIGVAAASAGHVDRARRSFERALELDPANEEAWLWLAALSSDAELARAIYQRVLRSHPDSERARRALQQLDSQQKPALPVSPEPRQAEEPAPAPATPAAEGAAPSTPVQPTGADHYVPPWELSARPAESDAQAASSAATLAAASAATEADSQPATLRRSTTPRARAPADSAVPAVPPAQPRSAASADAENVPTPGESQPHPSIVASEVSSMSKQRPAEQPASAPESQPEARASTVFEPLKPGRLPRQERISAARILRDGAMLAMLGFILLGSLALLLLLGNTPRIDRVRAAIGVFTETPTITPTPSETPIPTATWTPTLTSTPTQTPTLTPSPTTTPSPTLTPSPTAVPAWMSDPKFLPLPTDEKWIEVDLTQQSLTAYEGTTVVFTTTISSGKDHTPTVVGKFRIKRKLAAQLMAGPGYYLPDVPWVQYFYANFALHGAYWHDKWGTPTSHGCVNLRIDDAKWLYDWTDPQVPEGQDSLVAKENEGTWVIIHK